VVHKAERKDAIERANTAIANASYKLPVVGWKKDVVVALECGSFRLRQGRVQMEAVLARPNSGTWTSRNREMAVLTTGMSNSSMRVRIAHLPQLSKPGVITSVRFPFAGQ
jgi:hypothetical protein